MHVETVYVNFSGAKEEVNSKSVGIKGSLHRGNELISKDKLCILVKTCLLESVKFELIRMVLMAKNRRPI